MARATAMTDRNVRLAKQRWAGLPKTALIALRELSREHQLSVALGDLLYLNEHWYVSHAGLLRIAQRKKCSGINVECVAELSDRDATRWAFKATVFKPGDCKGFVGYGDADPSNVSSLVRGAEMRVAETRAVNRALRKAYGIGICSVEEIGTAPIPNEKFPPQKANGNGNGNGAGPKVRDRLCQLIRQHKLDPELVKAYAVDFCGTKTLREASREQVENFVRELGRLGREGSECSRLPTQQLRAPKAGGGRMKRQVPGLAETARDSRPEIPDGIFLVRVDGAQFRWHATKAVLCPPTFRYRAAHSIGSTHRGSSLLHAKSDVEAGLVPAGFSL